MASDPAYPAAGQRRDREVPLWRLYLMRAVCLLGIVTFSYSILPHLFVQDPANRGMLTSMLAGLWVLALFGLRYPLQLLPLFLFEFVWKSIWLLAFGLPRWAAGVTTPQFQEDIWSIGIGPLLFGLVIPWGYVWRHYIGEPSERWR